MTHRGLIALAMAACLCAAHASAATRGGAPVWASDAVDPPRELLASVDVHIGIDGSVIDARVDSDLEHDTSVAVQKLVSSWQFVPVQVDGHAVDAKTRVLITFQPAAPGPAPLGWKIVDVSLGEPALARRALLMPDYPWSAWKAHLGAQVVLVLKLNAKGKVAAAHAEQINLTSPGDDRLAGQWRDIFRVPSIRAAKSWKFLPAEGLDGEPVETSVRMAVTFVYYGDRAHRYYPGPITPAPWLDPAATTSSEQRPIPGDGKVIPLESRFRLRKDVVGQVI